MKSQYLLFVFAASLLIVPSLQQTCSTNPVVLRNEAVEWYDNGAPEVDVERLANGTQVTFTLTLDPNYSCWDENVTIDATYDLDNGDFTSFIQSRSDDGTNYIVDFTLNDSDLGHANICVASDDDNGVVTYLCNIFYQAYYEDTTEDLIMNWEYPLSLQLLNEQVIGLSIVTDEGQIAEDTVNLPLVGTFVTDAIASGDKDGTQFVVGDDAFIHVQVPEALRGTVTGSMGSVVFSDLDDDEPEYTMTIICEETVQDDGSVVVRVPMIFVTEQATIAVTINWELGSSRRVLETVNTTRYTIDVSIGADPDSTDNSEDDSSDSSSGEFSQTSFFLGTAIGVLVGIVCTFVSQKVINKVKKTESGAQHNQIPVSARA